jgi:hypothetical protein
MSDNQTIFIPVEPSYVPDDNTVQRIKELASAVLKIFDQVQFVDCGENLEQITCPFCRADLSDWWSEAMNTAYSPESGFSNLSVSLPCCGRKSSLNELDYNWPIGFGRTSLTFDDNELPFQQEELLTRLQHLSGITWRVVRRHI